MRDELRDDSARIFDRDDLLARLGGDEQMLEAIVRVFLEDATAQLSGLRDAVRSRDPKVVRLRAHGLKGAAANLAAEPLRSASLALEQAGVSQDISSMSHLLVEVERELGLLCGVLKKLI
ncbi:MAG: Hpt domain-containing protein [Deltaproteobacteria bacterium]|nr:Hpt domain-containing protein [Deltaproteobacteria bacterium]